MAGPIPGREAKLYYNTGTFGTPTWTEVARVVDLDWDMPVSWAAVPSREALWNYEVKALQGLVVNFGYRRRSGVSDTVYTAIRGYALATTKQELAIADGVIATTGTQYLRATFQFGMSRDEPMEDAALDSFEAHVTYEEDAGTARAPTWTVV